LHDAARLARPGYGRVLPNAFIFMTLRSITMIDPTINAIAAAAEASSNGTTDDGPVDDHETDGTKLAAAKLRDTQVAGFEPEFSPDEAEAAGAFVEDALNEADAREDGPAWRRFLAAVLSPKA
jgi:hypothetical protein